MEDTNTQPKTLAERNVSNCILIGINAGLELIDSSGITIIGDDIKSLETMENCIVFGDANKLIIGPKLFGEDSQLYHMLKQLHQNQKENDESVL